MAQSKGPDVDSRSEYSVDHKDSSSTSSSDENHSGIAVPKLVEAEEIMVVPFNFIGNQEQAVFPKVSIYAGLEKRSWLTCLQKNGYAGLVFPKGMELFKSRKNEPSNLKICDDDGESNCDAGIFSSWWISAVASGTCTSNTVKSHDDRNHDARFLTLRDYFPMDSVLCHIMCLVTKVLYETGDKIYAGTLQYLTSSSHGFSTRYWVDITRCQYRVFLYFGREYDPVPESGYITNTAEEDCAFITYGRPAAMKLKRKTEVPFSVSMSLLSLLWYS